ncbi:MULTISPECIES: hypothetical protein [Stappiaceae]|jgi:hypothetical protein|uniref:Lipocalin-like protein n=1 Tax=Roseibium aggregatum TaxID=187304 RepID=A0A0M6YAJ2_9HYPH|nr:MULTISPECIES: hypothetical protein [Stappiaceae]MCR9283075.1 hypothetical protein [Paracoccaceae bacterium]MEC9404950.1 hypothetical protein [Pseudomonadota bacterium]AMN51571.1 hypothetical protein ACP90_02975 [Labrenzia sp. CP4]ERP87786.1 hypothetical protein Q669_13565 [Labrenzia sp. C1B10]ERS08090.1 hypothetical protein Q675_22195 [Labrenzia sp. C1B70]
MIEDKLAPFLGTWILDTEESDFEQGEPPRSATLKIDENFGVAVFTMNQVASDGEVTNDTFEAMPDGPEVRLGKSGLVDAMRLVFQGDRNLISEARRGGLTIMKADRELSDDGRTLTVTQTVHLVDVASYTNVSVYRRAQ